ncbi:cysteine-rich motor neuron 1 protein-like isoform X2 [Asterias rubens]|uniref:cysteine-rich motor neuron 1 protein-like isoform X2 n=1 Tax=Asterias rubens TaxID=7604 RepID=UPI001455D8B2|nr:cysteine-rich motor neuron 1 protein-like isoform X2 [Asterias rubens]
MACCSADDSSVYDLSSSSSSSDGCTDDIRDDLPCEYKMKGRVVDRLVHGETIQIDECSACTCGNSTLSCKRKTCPELHCSPSQRMKIKWECCETCPETFVDVVRNDLPCKHNGYILLHNEYRKPNECSSCACDNATFYCQYSSQPTCGKSKKIKGQGCEICDFAPTPVNEDVEGKKEMKQRPLPTGNGKTLEQTGKMNKRFAALVSIIKTQR